MLNTFMHDMHSCWLCFMFFLKNFQNMFRHQINWNILRIFSHFPRYKSNFESFKKYFYLIFLNPNISLGFLLKLWEAQRYFIWLKTLQSYFRKRKKHISMYQSLNDKTTFKLDRGGNLKNFKNLVFLSGWLKTLFLKFLGFVSIVL